MDMYGQYIAGRGPVINVQIPTSITFAQERDPKIVALEQNVNSRMSSAIDSVTPAHKKLPCPIDKIRIVSYKEAIMELANSLKLTDNKS